MTVDVTIMAKSEAAATPTYGKVNALAGRLLTFLQKPDTAAEIAKHHVLGGASTAIQAIILQEATRLGFQTGRGYLHARPEDHKWKN